MYVCVYKEKEKKKKRRKQKQKLGHLHGTDTSPCKQIFENVRVWRGKQPQAMRKNNNNNNNKWLHKLSGWRLCAPVSPLASLGRMRARQVGGGGGDGQRSEVTASLARLRMWRLDSNFVAVTGGWRWAAASDRCLPRGTDTKSPTHRGRRQTNADWRRRDFLSS